MRVRSDRIVALQVRLLPLFVACFDGAQEGTRTPTMLLAST